MLNFKQERLVELKLIFWMHLILKIFTLKLKNSNLYFLLFIVKF